MHRWWFALLLIAGCSPPSAQPPPPAPTVTTTSTTAAGIPPVEVPPCLAGEAPHVDSGSAGAAGRSATDARTLREIAWDAFEGCERITFAFDAEAGAPAVVPPAISAVFDRTTGVLRVGLPPEVDRSVVFHHRVDTELVDRLYVVGMADGTLAIDLHLAAPALVRAQASTSPSRVTVDLVPGGPPYGATPLHTESVVVLTPTGGSVTYPFTVTGYAHGELGTVRIAGGPESVDATTTAAEALDGWSAFVALFPQGPVGPVRLEVGGVVIDLVVSG